MLLFIGAKLASVLVSGHKGSGHTVSGHTSSGQTSSGQTCSGHVQTHESVCK